MKLAVLFISFFCSVAQAQTHQHVKHLMVLFGESPTYLSHVVYKSPHNYQVLLEAELDAGAQAVIRTERARFPDDTFYLAAEALDISAIESEPDLTGQVIRVGSSGEKVTVLSRLQLKAADYKLLFFNELPLNL